MAARAKAWAESRTYVRLAREVGSAVEVIDLSASCAQRRCRSPLSQAEPAERLLSILSFFVPPEGDTGSRVAALLEEKGVVHREVAASRVRLFFATPVDAARAALALAPHLPSALGLHTGPVRTGIHPITAQPLIHGEHAAQPDDLAALEPAGLIYTTRAFAALLGRTCCPGRVANSSAPVSSARTRPGNRFSSFVPETEHSTGQTRACRRGLPTVSFAPFSHENDHG